MCAGSVRTNSIALRRTSTTASRPPNASATTSFEPSREAASSRGQNGSSRSPKATSDESALALPLAIDTNNSRRDQADDKTHEVPSPSTASRTGPALSFSRSSNLTARFAIFHQQELIRCVIGDQQPSAPAQHRQIRQAAADVVFSHHPARCGIDDRKAAALPVGHQHGLASIGKNQSDGLAHAGR